MFKKLRKKPQKRSKKRKTIGKLVKQIQGNFKMKFSKKKTMDTPSGKEEFQNAVRLFMEDKICEECLTTIISYLDIVSMCRISEVCTAFEIASKAAVLTRKSFSTWEYNRMLDLKRGVSEAFLFYLVSSAGIENSVYVNSAYGDVNIFEYSCYMGFNNVLYHLLSKFVPTRDCYRLLVIRGHKEMLKTMVEANRVRINFDHNCLIRLAATQGHWEILMYLLQQKGMDPCDLKNYALKNAIRYKRVKCLMVLLKDPRIRDSVDKRTMNRVISVLYGT